jgi:DamX protein
MKNLPLKILCLGIIVALTGCASKSSSTASYSQARESFEVQDYKTAFEEVQTPAASGNADAEYALGYMYYYGKGTQANPELGKNWIARSAAQGNETALQAYQMILAREETGQTIATQASKMATPEIPNSTSPSTQTHAVTPSVETNTTAIIPTVKTTHFTKQEEALLTVPATHFTIQLSVETSNQAAAAFIQTHHLATTAQVFRRQLNHHLDYVIIIGNYPNRRAATLAVKKLPATLRALHPWSRSYGDIQKQLQTL